MESNKETHWLFLRGLARESRHWNQLPSLFEERIPGSVMYMIDLPGTGLAYDQNSPISIEGMADFVRDKFLQRRKTSVAPLYIVAISMGAMVATAWAEKHPDEIDGMVFMNTSFANFSWVHDRLSVSQVPALLAVLREKDVVKRELGILQVTTNLVPGKEQIAKQFSKYAQEYPISTATILKQVFAAARYKAPLEPPVKNTLLLAGGRDRMVSPDCSLKISQKWQVPLMVHPTAGHDLGLDLPRWVIAKVVEWLESIDRTNESHASTLQPETPA